MTTDPSNQFPDLDQRGRAAALAVRESVAYTSLIPTDVRISGTRSTRRWAIVGAMAVVGVAVGVLALRTTDREAQGIAPITITGPHFAPTYVPDGMEVSADDASIKRAPEWAAAEGAYPLTVYERPDGGLVALRTSSIPIVPDDGETETPGPEIGGSSSTWIRDDLNSMSVLVWRVGPTAIHISGVGLAESDLVAIAELAIVTPAGATVDQEGLELRFGPGPFPFAPSGWSANESSISVRDAAVPGDRYSSTPLTIGRVAGVPGVEYVYQMFARSRTQTTFGGHKGWRLTSLEGGIGIDIAFVWQDGNAVFVATGTLDEPTMESVIRSLEGVDDATWQAILQRTEDLPDELTNDG